MTKLDYRKRKGTYLYLDAKSISLFHIGRYFDVPMEKINTYLDSINVSRTFLTEENYNLLEEKFFFEKAEAMKIRKDLSYIKLYGFPDDHFFFLTCGTCYIESYFINDRNIYKPVIEGANNYQWNSGSETRTTFFKTHQIVCNNCRNTMSFSNEHKLFRGVVEEGSKGRYGYNVNMRTAIIGGHCWAIIPIFKNYESGLKNDYSKHWNRKSSSSNSSRLSEIDEDTIMNALMHGEGDAYGY